MSYHAAYPNRGVSGFSGLGTLMRQNPLPPGRYWVNSAADNRDDLSAWMGTNRATVRVVNTTTEDATSDWPAVDFYIFTVSAPTPWDATRLGYPTIAPNSIQSVDDTVQAPTTESSTQILQSAADTVTKIAFWSAIVIGGVLVLKTADAIGLLRPAR